MSIMRILKGIASCFLIGLLLLSSVSFVSCDNSGINGPILDQNGDDNDDDGGNDDSRE